MSGFVGRRSVGVSYSRNVAQPDLPYGSEIASPERSPPDAPKPLLSQVGGRELAALLPGVAALFVGLLYAAGGMALAGELAAADFPLQDTLPLTPLQQI